MITADFLDALTRSQLLSSEQLAEVRATPKEDDAVLLAKRLVKERKLTRWQAQQLLAGAMNFFLGNYKLLNKLGEGGMGAVYLAEQTNFASRKVAIKVVLGRLVKIHQTLDRFQREVQLVSQLDHPHIIRALDAGQVGDSHYLVMEYSKGWDLKAWMRQNGRLPIGWSCECIRQAALGLQYAFEQGLVHRDIKPANLLVTGDQPSLAPLVKILDMGLARFTSVATAVAITKTGQVVGTAEYVAPEQAEDPRAAMTTADIFSLGCSLFHMLTEESPYPGDSQVERLVAKTQQTALRARSFRSEIPRELDEVLAKMLARRPEDRYPTPAEAAEALRPFCLATQ